MKKIVAGPVEYVGQCTEVSNRGFVNELKGLLARLIQATNGGPKHSSVIESSLRAFLGECECPGQDVYSELELTEIFKKYQSFVDAYAEKLGLDVVGNYGQERAHYMDVNPSILTEAQTVALVSFVYEFSTGKDAFSYSDFLGNYSDSLDRCISGVIDSESWAFQPTGEFLKPDLAQFKSDALRALNGAAPEAMDRFFSGMVESKEEGLVFSGMSPDLILVVLSNVLAHQPAGGYSRNGVVGNEKFNFHVLKDSLYRFLETEFSTYLQHRLTPPLWALDDSVVDVRPGERQSSMQATPLRHKLPGMLPGDRGGSGISVVDPGSPEDQQIRPNPIRHGSGGANHEVASYNPSAGTPSRRAPLYETRGAAAAAGGGSADLDPTMMFFTTVLETLDSEESAVDSTACIRESEDGEGLLVFVNQVQDPRLSSVFSGLTPDQQREISDALNRIQTPGDDESVRPDPDYTFNASQIREIVAESKLRRPSIQTPGASAGYVVTQDGRRVNIGDTIEEESDDEFLGAVAKKRGFFGRRSSSASGRSVPKDGSPPRRSFFSRRRSSGDVVASGPASASPKKETATGSSSPIARRPSANDRAFQLSEDLSELPGSQKPPESLLPIEAPVGGSLGMTWDDAVLNESMNESRADVARRVRGAVESGVSRLKELIALYPDFSGLVLESLGMQESEVKDLEPQYKLIEDELAMITSKLGYEPLNPSEAENLLFISLEKLIERSQKVKDAVDKMIKTIENAVVSDGVESVL